MATKSSVDPNLYTTDYVRSDFAEMSFLGNPHIDAITSALQAIGAEVWATRRRLYVVEALMAKNIPVTPTAIQAYVPTKEEELRWRSDRDRMVNGIYSPFTRAGEVAFPSSQTQSYDPHKQPEIARRPPLDAGDLKVERQVESAANVPAPAKRTL
jgi:hypothetical protein